MVYSDDSGQTIHQTHVPNLVEAKIIEANGQYVALLNMQDNAIPTEPHIYRAIYALDSTPPRTSVASISALVADAQSIAFLSLSNALYQIESCTNLIDSTWNSYGLPISGTGTNLTVDLPENITSPIYFRVRAIND